MHRSSDFCIIIQSYITVYSESTRLYRERYYYCLIKLTQYACTVNHAEARAPQRPATAATWRLVLVPVSEARKARMPNPLPATASLVNPYTSCVMPCSTVPMHRTLLSVPVQCPFTVPCTVPLYRTLAPYPCTVPLYRTLVPCPCTVPLHRALRGSLGTL